MFTDSCTGQWFAVQVKMRREKLTACLLREKGYYILVPEHVHSVGLGQARKTSVVYLFPGYLFVINIFISK